MGLGYFGIASSWRVCAERKREQEAMTYHFSNQNPDQPLPLVEPAYAYPGNPGPSTWQEFGLGQTDEPAPPPKKTNWLLWGAVGVVAVGAAVLLLKKEQKKDKMALKPVAKKDR